MRTRWPVAPWLLALVLLLPGTGRAQLAILPAGSAAAEGNQTMNTLQFTGAQTVQQAYSQAELAGLGLLPGLAITGFAWRLDGTVTTALATGFAYNHFDVTLSTTASSPTGLSTLFAANLGNDATLVRSGSLTFAANVFSGGGSPNAFGPVVAFTTPFVYQGGTLLLMYTHDGSSLAPLVSTDGTTAAPGSFIHTTAYAATSGSSYGLKDIVAFQFTAVPEPPVPWLLAAGAALLGAARRAIRRAPRAGAGGARR